MTRQEIEQTFVVIKSRIRTLGQFENEMVYVPYFWNAYLNGFADDDDGTVLSFDVTQEDIKQFPELQDRKTVKLYQRDDGFICEVIDLR
jgi:hypothetical protein